MKKAKRESVGIVKRHPDGFGFFVSDDPDQVDVYIPRQAMKGIMTNDRVRVKVEREHGGDRFRGEIEEVLSRAVTRVVGQYHEMGPSKGLLMDKSFAWGEDLHVTPGTHADVKSGDLVVVQIEDYPDSKRGFCGKVVAVIGDAADPLNDSIRVLHSNNIPHEFSAAAIKQAESLSPEVTEKDWQGREDLRRLPIITIDGKTAKDFDDAVFTEKTATGFHLYVAIADVSHYVKEGSPIDDDAIERGTSTYFPNFVAPMLPEKLSNELCSLKPKVPRLALVAEMWLNHQGDLERSKFYEGVIQSQARVTYGQAQEVIDGATVPELAHVRENILRCADLAKVLMAKRFREGSLDLELPETEIEMDESGMPVDIMRSERLFSHRLIEELMLMANVAVAKHFKEKDVPALYRIHEEPATEAIGNFESFLKAFGYGQRVVGGGHLQKKISKALEHFRNHPKSHVLNMLALRSLAQAKYSANNVGHFGLGFADYTHFTSPIRRYPDLIVHRLLKATLRLNGGYRLLEQSELETAGTMLSACEQRSVKAERQIKAIKKARFLSKFIGEEFEGLISSVTKFGLFVLLRQFDVDGLLRTDALGNEPFDFDEENLRLVARRSGMTYEIGELVKVTVAKADTESGQIDFVLAGKPLPKPGEERERFPGNRPGRGGDRGGRNARPRRDRQDERKKSFKPSRREQIIKEAEARETEDKKIDLTKPVFGKRHGERARQMFSKPKPEGAGKSSGGRFKFGKARNGK